MAGPLDRRVDAWKRWPTRWWRTEIKRAHLLREHTRIDRRRAEPEAIGSDVLHVGRATMCVSATSRNGTAAINVTAVPIVVPWRRRHIAHFKVCGIRGLFTQLAHATTHKVQTTS